MTKQSLPLNVISIMLFIVLSGCSHLANQHNGIDSITPVYFSCESDTLVARFTDEKVFLTGFGFSDELYITKAASGARYQSDNDRVFWAKGHEALLQTGPVITQNCIQVDSPSPTTTIDIPFTRASGNEPFWHLIVADQQIHWSTLSGENLEFTLEQRLDWAHGLFTVLDSENAMALLVSSAQCIDSMSGTLFPFTVQALVTDELYSGCAGSAASMLFGDWTVVAVGDTSPSTEVTLSFDDEGNVFGSDGCNRFMGGYQVNEGFSVSPLAGTRRACFDDATNQFASIFMTALQQGYAIERPDANTLIVKSANGEQILAQRQ